MSNQENNEDKKWEAPASMGDDFDFLDAYGAVEEVKNDDQLDDNVAISALNCGFVGVGGGGGKIAKAFFKISR